MRSAMACHSWSFRFASGQSRQRRGTITVLSAFLLVVILAVAAFAIDVGMICCAKAELQRTADASALAATSELLSRYMRKPSEIAAVVAKEGTAVRLVADSTAADNQ